MNVMPESLSPNKVSLVIEQVMHSLSIGFIFLFPLLFLPTTTNFYQPNKLALTVIVAAVSLLLWALKMVVEKKTILHLNALTLPLLAMAIVTIISSLAATGDSTEQFLGRGGLVPALIIWMIALTNMVTHKKFVTQALYALFASTTILSVIAVFQGLGLGLSNVFNSVFGTTIPNDLSFTPAGTPLGFISLSLPIGIATLLMAITRKEILEKVVLFLLSAIIASGTILTIIFSLPGKETTPSILPLKYGYSIAVDTLKNTKTLLVGYGPESFLNAFTRTRPVGLNQSDMWNVRFTSSSSEVLNLLTTTGVLGLLAWIAMVVSLLRLNKVSGSNSHLFTVIKVVALVFVLLQLLLPSSYTLLFGFLVLLALAMLLVTADSKETGSSLNLTAESIAYSKGSFTLPLLPILFSLILASLAGYGLYHTVRAYAAEAIFRQSLTAAASNQGVATYDKQRTAIQNYPTVSRFRRAYAATNLALANSLAGKENISEDEKKQVNQLIQQAIREGKAAVTLDQTNVLNWESLALVYRSLIGVAQEAPQWTLATYSQAIQVDPSNPQLWLQLGGVYYTLQQYDQAVRVFQRVTELKPDFANAYYNLASAHIQRKETVQAYQAMQRTVALLEAGSADFVKAQEELAKLEEQVKKENPQAVGTQPNAQAPAQGELQTPLPTPTANPQVRVDLNEESGPQTLPQEQETQVDEVLEQPAPTPAP